MTKDIYNIICEISSTNKTFVNIARKYKCSQRMIDEINTGHKYKIDGVVYPLRQHNKYSIEKMKQIIYALKYEMDKTLKQISDEYNIDYSQLYKINQGHIYIIKGQKYPIRNSKTTKLSDKEVKKIISLLKDKSIQQKDIAKVFNVSTSTIDSINKGSIYFIDDVEYPIRKNYQRRSDKETFIENDELREIESELFDSELSMRKIAKIHNLSFTTILNINKGVIKKYKNNNIKYPIRN